MSGWSRTVKPSADTTKLATDILGADATEVAATPGIASVGWIHVKKFGNRTQFETLVTMKTPPVEDDTDDTILPDIMFTTQPSSLSVVAGNPAVFTVVSTGSPTFQWEVSTNGGTTWTNLTDGANVAGSTTASVTITTVTGDNGSLYRCVATQATKGTITSHTATLTVS